jgi:hypothetical protein
MGKRKKKDPNEMTINEAYDAGYCVIVFSPKELRGAKPHRVSDVLVDYGWDVIDGLATEPAEEEA